MPLLARSVVGINVKNAEYHQPKLLVFFVMTMMC
jgi:hypothetical protein